MQSMSSVPGGPTAAAFNVFLDAAINGVIPDQNVARLCESCQLAREHLFVTEIVADRGQGGRVGGQRDGGPGTTLLFVTADEFGSDVLRIRRAATISTQQNFSTAC